MKTSNRILLIDDDVDDQLYFRDAVNEINPSITCEIANNGKEALQQIEIPPLPDIIFLDLNMPVMNGFECLSSLKKKGRYQDIPVVIFTTSKNADDISRTRELGASFFFTKPTDFNTLCHKLKTIIGKGQANASFIV
jgi:CheY-like chemotaxis protein